ncbi:prepilin peptidase [Sinorhizobium sp. 7-81]|uniref:A24 family peptidase n=1 Tax=Sinorhizobium sp. 8-89 TaxID=3049089 RepID=UPI0024C31A50|nr:prepilin peptidase [Sinorhizobium sp. 8-89]MDK1492379.1 prepilin peptidase [Sinorhizobium sp. 8-89]
MIAACILVIFPFCLAFAAFTDLFTMTIPNRVSGILFCAFVAVAPLAGLGIEQIGIHIMAATLVFAVCFCLFAVKVMGGGDAKLLTASAIWFGLNASLAMFLFYVSIFGAILTLVVLFLRKQENAILATGVPVPHLLLTAKKIPYGIAIALGGFAAYPSSPLMRVMFAQLS